MELKNRITNLRARCEEYFYAASSILDKEQAEQMSVIMLRMTLQDEIKLHEEYVKISETHVNNYREKDKELQGVSPRMKFERGQIHGVKIANQGRAETHMKAITEAKKNIEVLDLHLI